MPEHFEHVLANGLTILAEPTPTARSVAMGLFVKTGSRDETPDVNGVSHFLEHMMFKGSDARDAEAMNRIFDELGARYNAFTTQEMTAYYAQVLPEFTEAVCEHLGHLLRPAIRQADFDMEKKVILEEISMYEDDPGHRIFEKVMAEHFKQHALGMSILGPATCIEQLKRDQMATYLREHYGPRNMVLSVTGQFDFEQIKSLAQQNYGGWEPIGCERDYTSPAPTGGREAMVDEKLSRQYVMAITPGPSAQDEGRFAARILSDVLGDGENSRLYWALVDPAIAEEADFGTYSHDRTGSYVLSLVCNPGRGDECLETAVRELKRVRDDLTADEVERSKNKLSGQSVLHGESTMGRMRAIGGGWIYNDRYRSLEEDLSDLLAVSKDDVAELLERFTFDPMTVVTLGPGEA
ncbi:MAG: pitrilysin family protein [Planctomycetota bacterium]